jgi:hypothetical protein
MGDPGKSNATERILRRDLADHYGERRGNDGPYADNLDIDVLIVGGECYYAQHWLLRSELTRQHRRVWRRV